MNNTKKQLLRSIVIVSLLCVDIVVAMTSALAVTLPQSPRLLAQQVNGRIATLQCGGYNITIRFVGYASSQIYSYKTKGLFLKNGSNEGNDYIFNNNDYEYRVTTEEGGKGRLQVFHYGERVLNKKCTWS